MEVLLSAILRAQNNTEISCFGGTEEIRHKSVSEFFFTRKSVFHKKFEKVFMVISSYGHLYFSEWSM